MDRKKKKKEMHAIATDQQGSLSVSVIITVINDFFLWSSLCKFLFLKIEIQ